MSTVERRVGRYQIVRQIGRGGMAIVYLARQETLDRDVALKELSSFHASAPEMAQRFLQESRLAGSLNHPNIVTVLEYFEDDGVPYIAMEYVRRGSLRPYVSRLSTAQFVGVMEGVLAGLAHAETHGIVHRDLKPENIMVTADGRVKITDFGIAKATQAAGTGVFLTAAGTTVGTPTYMAPEQAMGRDIGIWTDLYSVGVMAWEHVVGRVPFYDSDVPMVILTRQLNEEIPGAVSVNPDADPDLSDWIDRLLVKDPSKRAQSPNAVWDDLEEIIINRLGPRWRREARLPSPSQVFDTPHPLTPAPFESQQVRTPEPEPAPEPAPEPSATPREPSATPREWEPEPEPEQPEPEPAPSATPAQTPPATPLAEPVIAAEEAQPEPKPQTGYVTFGPAGDVAAAAAVAAAAEAAAVATPETPVATPETPVATPETPGATPETPVATPETPVATPETPRATPETPVAVPEAKVDAPVEPAEPGEPPERHEPTYVTYGRGPEPVAPVEPEPVEPPAPEEAVTEPQPEPVAQAGPALEGETLPGLGQSVPEPVTEPVPEREPEPGPEPRQPEPEPRQPETARAPRPARQVVIRRRAILAGVVGVIAAAVIGLAVAPKGGGGGSTTTQTSTQPPQPVSNGPITVSIPAGWQRQSPPSIGAGVQLQNQIVVGPSAPAGGTLVIGTANTTDPSLLPNALLTAASGGAPARQVVTLGGSQFYRYLDLQPSGVNGPVSVYALPTTTAGTVLGACFIKGAGASFAADCERVLGSLKLSGASPVGLGPSSSLATRLSAAVGTLNKAVSAGQARLHSAGKPGQQAAAASQLATAYTQAAAAVRKLGAPSTASVAVAALAASLAKTGHDYAALSRAAAHNDGHAYKTAGNAISADSGSVTAAFAQLAKLGYAS